MGVALQGNVMYIAIVTGQRPDNGLMRYSPGDIYMTTPVGVVGIEVGGGVGAARVAWSPKAMPARPIT